MAYDQKDLPALQKRAKTWGDYRKACILFMISGGMLAFAGFLKILHIGLPLSAVIAAAVFAGYRFFRQRDFAAKEEARVIAELSQR